MTNRARRCEIEMLEGRRLFVSPGQLLAYDFNTATVWPSVPGTLSAGVSATQAIAAAGTIDVKGGTTRTNAVTMTVTAVTAGAWSSELSSGLLAVNNSETNLGKLTLGFMLSTSQNRPVKVKVFSYNAQNVKTGGLETLVYPAAADTYQKYSVDFSTMKPSGAGTFTPTSPKISFAFEANSQLGWTTATTSELRVDNVNYSKPAYYVKPTGSNSNNGLTEATAFATPQKALDVAQAGDIILLMAGTYSKPNSYSAPITVRKSGTPAAWITVKSYPGQTATLFSDTWATFRIGEASSAALSTAPALAYIEVRGLRMRGVADTLPTTNPSVLGTSDARANTGGVYIDGRYEQNEPHHIRVADNVTEYLSGGGIGALEADHLQIENNVVANNCWWSIYAGSGISVFSAVNFDGTSGGYTRIVRNNYVSGNQTFYPWAQIGRISDGNGIIIDVNHNTTSKPTSVCVGRTLVQSNIVFNNGGSGIHAFKADFVDIFNNTAYMNSASTALQYSQIFSQGNDTRIYNNILVAPVANTAAGELAEPINGGNTPNATNQIVYHNNLYWGGNVAPKMGTGDRILDPKMIAPTIDPATANFKLQPTSPSINAGLTTTLLPLLDYLGNPLGTEPDIGAFQYVANLASINATNFDLATRQAITFNFDRDASPIFRRADFSIQNLTTNPTLTNTTGMLSFNPAGNAATLLLTNLLADGNYRVTHNSSEILDAAGGATSISPVTYDFYVLGADGNRDRKVDTVDFNVLLSNFGGAGRTFTQGNYSYDMPGVINSADFNVLVSQFGKSIAALPGVLPMSSALVTTPGSFANAPYSAGGDEPETLSELL